VTIRRIKVEDNGKYGVEEEGGRQAKDLIKRRAVGNVWMDEEIVQ
jgi:hypothetical protein